MKGKIFTISSEVEAENDPSPKTKTKPKSGNKLPLKLKLCYSLGHISNDLVASLWFSYLLLYLTSVLEFTSTMAGGLLLLGQVVDALSTPFVGIQSDKDSWRLTRRYGKRKTWHLIGSVLVTLSVPFIFHECLGCSGFSPWTQFAYFGAFITVMQFGWAAVQVSHVSLITDLTPAKAERVELNAYRYAATVVSQIIVYFVTWLILGSQGETNSHVGPNDATNFRNIVLIVLSIGVLFSAIFHFWVKEPTSSSSSSPYSNSTSNQNTKTEVLKAGQIELAGNYKTISYNQTKLDLAKPEILGNIENDQKYPEMDMSWKKWFRKIQFYQVALIYMSSRLFVNLSQVYMTLYLQDTLALPKQALATIPLVTNVSGLLFAFGMKPLSVKAGTKSILLFGCLVSCSASGWVYFGSGANYDAWQIYIVGGLFGIGGATMLVTSLAITVDMIGSNTHTCAFVFGAMGFFDKLANGGAIVIVQEINPFVKEFGKGNVIKNEYYRSVLVFGCGVAVLVTILGLFVLFVTQRRNTPKNENNNKEDVT